MSLTPNTKLGLYEILAPIGAGGMGKVYKARDTKLGREVAIKVLPAAFAENEERLARFEREARLLASLNHPNIATLFDLQESEGTHFLVLELVPGETLAERIAKGPIPVDEALPLFEQIAEGLESAHKKGIIHRDLKPANIKVTPEGKIKVLDFGLAKAMARDIPPQELSESPTITRDATETGVLLGTAPYMSPEQARGKNLDKRTDIWSFGCVFYEALTGKVAFLGETVSDTIAKILEREPDWSALPNKTPPLVRSLLRRCLKKDVEHRLRDIGDARLEIDEALSEPMEVVAPPSYRRSALPWILFALMAILTGVVLWSPWRTDPAETPPRLVRMSFNLPAGQVLPKDLRPFVALSPDGTRLVYKASEDGRLQLYLRELAENEVTPIPGTERAMAPFFSPDGQWVGFSADGKLKKVRLGGAGAHELCDIKARRGASWGPDDHIVFAELYSGLMKVSAAGGTPEVLTTLDPDKGEMSHRWPDVLPSGKGVLFSIVTGANYDDSSIVAQSFETGERQFLLNASYARYAPTGHLIYAREDTLYAVRFDLDRMDVSGSAIVVQSGVRVDSGGPGSAHFTFSDGGTLVYVPRPPVDHRLFLVDLEGKAEPIAAPPLPYFQARFSPDGQHLAVSVAKVGIACEIHVYELEHERLSLVTSRFESPLGTVFRPFGGIEWSPTGTSFFINATAPRERLNLFAIATDGSGEAERLTKGPGYQFPDTWSADGERLLYSDRDEPRTNGWGIFELSLADGSSRTVLDPREHQAQPALSPDGRWLAYISSPGSDISTVYVTRYPQPGGRQQVSTDSGTAPVWAPDGRTLYYRNGNRMMATSITTYPALSVGTPRLLFEGQYLSSPSTNPRCYDLAPDGKRFVMIRGEGESRPNELQVVLNWFDEVKRLVPKN